MQQIRVFATINAPYLDITNHIVSFGSAWKRDRQRWEIVAIAQTLGDKDEHGLSAFRL
jgi:hypothetical protein